MRNFLAWLRVSMMVSGIIAELIPAITSELPKREKKQLIVTKVPTTGVKTPDEPTAILPEKQVEQTERPIAAGEDRFLKDEPNINS